LNEDLKSLFHKLNEKNIEKDQFKKLNVDLREINMAKEL